MSSSVGQLLMQARMEQRPRWSQQFLADELCLLGYETSREQIARLERSAPLKANPELLSVVAYALDLDAERVRAAIYEDYVETVLLTLRTLGLDPSSSDDERVPVRMPQRRRSFERFAHGLASVTGSMSRGAAGSS